jgi:predicted nucleic acid-binding Zn ribbon protein
MIEDQRAAAAYAIEVVHIFDHLHFRSVMQDRADDPDATSKRSLKKSMSLSGKPPRFNGYYATDSQKSKEPLPFVS